MRKCKTRMLSNDCMFKKCQMQSEDLKQLCLYPALWLFLLWKFLSMLWYKLLVGQVVKVAAPNWEMMCQELCSMSC